MSVDTAGKSACATIQRDRQLCDSSWETYTDVNSFTSSRMGISRSYLAPPRRRG
ncbi:MAG: hypothetical protein M3Z36_01660 [Acidobacteriota bacterium]|nr:hypothetical protein [Acidobacteriota bacterium]